MKPTSNFKFPKSAKMMLSNIRDLHHRGAIKRDLIQAILESNTKPKTSKEDRNRDEN